MDTVTSPVITMIAQPILRELLIAISFILIIFVLYLFYRKKNGI